MEPLIQDEQMANLLRMRGWKVEPPESPKDDVLEQFATTQRRLLNMVPIMLGRPREFRRDW